jgi:hypothetical protein
MTDEQVEQLRAVELLHSLSHYPELMNYPAEDVATVVAFAAARERAVWLEAAKYWDNNPPYSKLELVFPSDAYPKWGNVFAAWCRQRAEAVKP